MACMKKNVSGLLLGLFGVLIQSAVADEKLATLQVGNVIYTNVTVTSVTATDIYFTHAKGMGNARLKSLSPETQKKFGFDAAKSLATEKQQAEANAKFRATVAAQAREQKAAPPKVAEASAAEEPMAEGTLNWLTDLPQAQAQANLERKLVLLDFTGSDWCGWCIKLNKEVFSRSEFAEYAKNNLVCVEVDFPRRKKLNPEQKRANDALAAKYNISGYPTIIVLNSDGKKVGELGYMEGGPKTFMAQLDRLKR